jgi:purine-binding chemotaxis protein CheW
VTTPHVRLRVGEETYALPVGDVLEVTEVGEVAPIPGAPSAILGITNLHGEVVPVLDLARALGIEPGESASRLVLAERDGHRAGLAVSAVTDVGPLPEASEAVDSPHVHGATMVDGNLVGLLDLGSIFGSLGEAGP